MNKEELFKIIYPHFATVVATFYLQGKWNDTVIDALTKLKEEAKKLDLTAIAVPDGGDIILIVEKPEEYVIVSANVDLYTWEDEEMEAQ